MRLIGRVLRIFGLWILPFIVVATMLVLGFAYWCVSTEDGTRWLLRTAVAQFDGEVRGVQGSLRRDLRIEHLSVVVPGADVRIADLHLRALWPELLDRRLHIDELSARRLDLALHPAPEPDQASEPFHMPTLPVDVVVDRLALGGLGLQINGESPPVDLLTLSTALRVERNVASVRLDQLRAAWDHMLLVASGRLWLDHLDSPWPFSLSLAGYGQDYRPDSPLCLQRFAGQRSKGGGVAADKAAAGAASSPPATAAAKAAGSGEAAGAGAPAAARTAETAGSDSGIAVACRIDWGLDLGGSTEGIEARLRAEGEGMRLAARAQAFPGRAFPLGPAELELTLPDGSAAHLSLAQAVDAEEGRRILGLDIDVRDLALNAWLPENLGPSVLGVRGKARFDLDDAYALTSVGLDLAFDPASRWNGQALSGAIAAKTVGLRAGPLFGGEGEVPDFDPMNLVVQGLEADLKLGAAAIRASGDFSRDETRLSVQGKVPALAAVWPGLPGGAELDAGLAGSLAEHRLTLSGGYRPEEVEEGVLGRAPIDVKLQAQGAWTDEGAWNGTLQALDVAHAGLAAHSVRNAPLRWKPEVREGEAVTPMEWAVGPAGLAIALDGEQLLVLDLQSATGTGAHWATQGRVDPLLITPDRVRRVRRLLQPEEDDEKDGSIRTSSSKQAEQTRLVLRLAWSLAQEDALSGKIELARTEGDLVIPGDNPVAMGLEAMRLDLAIARQGVGLSQLQADLQVDTARMGTLRVRAATPLHSRGGVPVLEPRDPKTVHVEARSEDLAWVNLFLKGAFEVGGIVHADIHGRSLPDGRWTLSGPLQGEHIDILDLDQGLRLLDGTLEAHFDGQRLLLDSLRFPAIRRVTPKEWRTATWISEEPDAQNGSLTLKGRWDLWENSGDVDVVLHRYPIIQRADRYAMASGTLRIDSVLPKLAIRGKIEADAGWFDLDMLNNLPALDGDVVILKAGEEAQPQKEAHAPLDMDLDVTIGLGPRFYITGYGVNSGLVGELNLRMAGDRLTGMGELRTRGGSLDAYGQHLQLRRGTITFQGDVTNPVIWIEALRTDATVQAGVRVAGTARKPRIDLISYPDVSETEKLSWLLLGHGPDQGGGDAALLFSVGSSFLAGDEPFHQRFGLDALTLRSGEIGSTGSVLPVKTVVSSQDNSGASDIEQRFIVASKNLSKDLTASLEQALSETGTVARLSYRLLRGLRAELTVGTVTGLALVYRWFSAD